MCCRSSLCKRGQKDIKHNTLSRHNCQDTTSETQCNMQLEAPAVGWGRSPRAPQVRTRACIRCEGCWTARQPTNSKQSQVGDKHTDNPMLGLELREPKLSSTQRQWDWVLQHSKDACTPALDTPRRSAARHRARKQQQPDTRTTTHDPTLAAPTACLHLVTAQVCRGCCWGWEGGSLTHQHL